MLPLIPEGSDRKRLVGVIEVSGRSGDGPSGMCRGDKLARVPGVCL